MNCYQFGHQATFIHYDRHLKTKRVALAEMSFSLMRRVSHKLPASYHIVTVLKAVVCRIH